jgi:lipoprotein-anchoring transpeptidase ErfK/SrfK
VGLGRNGSTPIGAWHVKKGEKMEHPPYNATGSSGLAVGTRVLWGQPGYPFGVKGLWIGLEGLDATTSLITDFGIHSTNDPTSIGKANSLGCVRMADADIDVVFNLLYDVHSKVDVVP